MSHPRVHAVPPPVVAPDDWTPIRPFPITESTLSFVSGPNAADRFRVAYFERRGDRRLVGCAWFGPDAEGPPGHAHGGAMASVMDEVLGAAAWAAGHPIVVGRLTVDFRTMVPIGTDARFEAWIVRVDGRKVFTRGRLTSTDGAVFAEGEAVCITLPAAHFERLVDERARNRAVRGGV